jgi:hypothetical protein
MTLITLANGMTFLNGDDHFRAWWEENNFTCC